MLGPSPVTRRTAVGAAVAVGVAHLLPVGARAQEASSPAPVVGPALVPEIVTVTDIEMVAWWRTDEPQDTTVRITAVDGPSAGVLRELRLEESERVHVARVTDLEPGRSYRYELLSGGRRVSLGTDPQADPGEFTTLRRPKGRRLARIALLNDIHVGERCSGTITSAPGTSVPACYSADDYAHRMTEAAIEEIDRLPDVDLVLANGDLTDRGRPEEVARALALLRRPGLPLQVTRGNHDRRLVGACAPDGDCLRVQAFPDRREGEHALTSVRRVGTALTVIGLDSSDPGTGRARLDLGGQVEFLDDQLAGARREGRDAIVAFHHPLQGDPDPTSPADRVPEEGGARAVREVLARHPHARLVVHGHTHRNALLFDDGIGRRLPFLENGAIKEYPAGYAILDVHEDGIVRTFHRPDTPFTREWVRTTAMQINGFQPQATRGPLGSRAFVHGYAPTPGLAPPAPAAAVRLTAPEVRPVRRLRREGMPFLLFAEPGTVATATLVGRLPSLRDPTRRVDVRLARRRVRLPGKGAVRVRLFPRASLRERLGGRRTRATLEVRLVTAGQPVRLLRRSVRLEG